MGRIKSHWDNLSQYERLIILKRNRFWWGLREFEYKLIPEDLKEILKSELRGNQS